MMDYLPDAFEPQQLEDTIIKRARVFGDWKFGEKEFIPGESYISPSGKVIGGPEIENAVSAVLDGWLTEGHWVDEFEQKFAKWMGVRYASMTNSGSSANLVAISALKSELFRDSYIDLVPDLDERDEIITAACGFPTTLNPIIQNGFKPVLVDVQIGTYMPTPEQVLDAITDKTRAIFMAHTLGNPLEMKPIVDVCAKEGIFLIEDNCDALGSVYLGKRTGTIGVMATQSFYPAHHITTGEGGMVVTDSGRMKLAAERFRDWGRNCYCPPGEENTCGKRFDWDFEGLPSGYDHKYVYSEIGYNLKSTDLQAAIGVAQLDRIEYFIRRRRGNFRVLKDSLKHLDEFFVLPEASKDSAPSWFGFPITIRADAPFDRALLLDYLADKKVGTRNLFAGNLYRQPAYREFVSESSYFPNADRIAKDTFWVGLWPGITGPMLDYMADAFSTFCKTAAGR